MKAPRRVQLGGLGVLLIGTVLVLTLLPVLAVLAVAAGPLCGRQRPLRILLLAACYLVLDCLVVAACAGLWLSHGFGRGLGSEASRRHHYRLAQWFLDHLFARATSVLDVSVEYHRSAEGEALLRDLSRPVVMLARHGGVADSFLIARELLSRFERRPRIVMDQRLSVDPAIGLLGRRLEVVFVPPTAKHAVLDRIRAVATTLTRSEALLIFPEGGNFTRRRRERRIASIRRRDRRRARRVEELRNVLPVRPGGTLAALAGSPPAGVVILGHHGMGRIERPTEVFRKLPVGSRIALRLWAVEPRDLPQGSEAIVARLDERWAEVDRWIGEAAEEPAA